MSASVSTKGHLCAARVMSRYTTLTYTELRYQTAQNTTHTDAATSQAVPIPVRSAPTEVYTGFISGLVPFALGCTMYVLLPEPSETNRLLHQWRMRYIRLPTTRPTPRDLQEPIYPRKKCAIWTRWHLVPGKNANYLRAPSSRRSGLFGLYTTPPIVNYKYMTSTL